MSRRYDRLATLVSVLLAAAPGCALAHELCSTLRTFERSEMQQDGERRWVEFHWGYDPDAIWSWGCRHSDDKTAKATCDWLLSHTSREFSMQLPLAMMTCYGYRVPRFAYLDWAGIAGTITLRDDDTHRLVMDLNYRDLPKGEVAVRLSREILGRRYIPEQLPPIEPMAKTAKGGS